jgi:CheY-like chemotaxis protein
LAALELHPERHGGVTIQLDYGPEKLVQVHPVAFQQILLSLLDVAVQRSSRNRVILSTLTLDGNPGVKIETCPGRLYPESEAALQSARNLVELSSGSLAVKEKNGLLSITASFALAQRIEVLVIDDNPEITTMMQRFTAETLYNVSGLDDPKQAVEAALRLRPGIIILDIMMPQIDGLQVLSRIKHHPEIDYTPVIICSVLPQKDLALSLGATGFLNKPFQREAFLAALARVSPDQPRGY